MIENNRIIIVDDDEDDLQKLSSVFHTHGVGCKSFHYDGFNFPDMPLKGVRFAFFDIHLNQESDVNAPLKDAISKYISMDNGPFVLIFWSNNTDKITDFISFINRTDDEFRNKLRPISLEWIDKSDFIETANSLEEKLDSILSKDIVKCLIRFDEEVLEAATQTLDNLISTISFDCQWGDVTVFNENCKKVFSKIAVNSYGFEFAKENPDAAIKESIVPVFESILKQNNKTTWKEYLSNLENATRFSEIIFPETYSPATLNTIFHIDKYNIENRSKNERGAVCLIDSERIGEIFDSIFKTDLEKWFLQTFNGIPKDDIKSVRFIGVEFSAACDYSQNKKRTNKYLLGALLPEGSFNKLKNDKVGEYLLRIPFTFEIDGQNLELGFNLNYSFIEPLGFPFLCKPIFILKKEIMDMIGNRYANHVSRIGITSF